MTPQRSLAWRQFTNFLKRFQKLMLRGDPRKTVDSSTEVIKEIRDVEVGDFLDLEGDAFADPGFDPLSGTHCEYVPVMEKKRETSRCVRLDIEGVGSVGFPPGHKIIVSTEIGNEGEPG